MSYNEILGILEEDVKKGDQVVINTKTGLIKKRIEGYFKEDGEKPVYITYDEKGEKIVEPYTHQDKSYYYMCVSPSYCRCTN